jgi:hypothetical protein
MRRLGLSLVLFAGLLVVSCAPAAVSPPSVPKDTSPSVNQSVVDSHKRMVAALQRFYDENPVVREPMGDISGMLPDDVELARPIAITRVIKFTDSGHVAYGQWVEWAGESYATVYAVGEPPFNYPQDYFARLDAAYGAKPMTKADRAAFLADLKGEAEGVSQSVLRAVRLGDAIYVRIDDAVQLTTAERTQDTWGFNWLYDPKTDRVLSISLGDELDY